MRDGRDPPAGARFRKRGHRLEIIERITSAAMHFHRQGILRQAWRELDDRQITSGAATENGRL